MKLKAKDLESMLADARSRLAEIDPVSFKKHLEKFRSGARSQSFEARVQGGSKDHAPTADQIDRAIEMSSERYLTSAKLVIHHARVLELEERRWTEIVEPFDEDPSNFVCRSCGDTVANEGSDRLRKGQCQACYHRDRRKSR